MVGDLIDPAGTVATVAGDIIGGETGE